MAGSLDPGRALVRLWLFGSIVWLGFWAWRDGGGCFAAKNGTLWCPNAAGDALVATSYLRIGLSVLGPPLALLILGLAYLWFAARTQRSPDG